VTVRFATEAPFEAEMFGTSAVIPLWAGEGAPAVKIAVRKRLKVVCASDCPTVTVIVFVSALLLLSATPNAPEVPLVRRWRRPPA